MIAANDKRNEKYCIRKSDLITGSSLKSRVRIYLRFSWQIMSN